LLIKVVDPSPGLGWAGRERSLLPDRGRPLSELFDVADSTELPSATWILYRATPRG
jgi:hypothetical protein